MSAEEGPDLQSLSREELIALCEDLSNQFESAFRIVDQLEQENEGKNKKSSMLFVSPALWWVMDNCSLSSVAAAAAVQNNATGRERSGHTVRNCCTRETQTPLRIRDEMRVAVSLALC